MDGSFFLLRLLAANMVLGIWLWWGTGDGSSWLLEHAMWRSFAFVWFIVRRRFNLFCYVMDIRYTCARFAHTSTTNCLI